MHGFGSVSALILLFFTCTVSSKVSFQRNERRVEGGIHLPIRARGTKETVRRDGLSAVVGIGDYRDITYSVLLHIGDRDIPLVLDTGSADLWVVSDACTNCNAKGVLPPLYSQSRFQPTGLDVRLQYGDSRTGTHAYGSIGRETISLLGLALPAQYFAAINDTNTSVLDAGCSGIFGLGFPINSFIWHDVYIQSIDPMIPQLRRSDQLQQHSPLPSFPSTADFSSLSRINTRQIAPGSTATNAILASLSSMGPLIPRIVMLGIIEAPMFTVALQRDTVDVGGNIGMLSIGELPQGLKSESLTWSNVRGYTTLQKGLPPPADSPSETYPMAWEVYMDDVYFDGVKLPRSTLPTTNIALTALIDTGNSLIRGPADVVANIFSRLGSNQFDCSTPHTLAFQINGKMFPIDPRDFITPVSPNSTDKCFANLVSTDTPVEGENYLYSWSLGAPFLKGVIASFHYGNITYPSRDPPRIGFMSTVPADAGERLRVAISEASRKGGGMTATSEPAPSGTFIPTRPNETAVAKLPSPYPSSTTSPSVSQGDGLSNAAVSPRTGIWEWTIFVLSGLFGLYFVQVMP